MRRRLDKDAEKEEFSSSGGSDLNYEVEKSSR